ncbi:MAG: heparinase II/III family protein, partial [Planctomycetota bacterium]|nr:heparinase II/III family protein [Planctomycetota bacterium]
RAAKELEAAAAFHDWNPSHFLDTAEMSCALGIGYDWLYDYLSKEQRATVRKALMEKGLGPGLKSYRGTGKFGWWTRAHHNWSQVCNGGLAVGALAVSDEEPAAAREVLASGLKAVLPAMANFGPDGSWNEGPGYWGYTLLYTSYYLGALQSALGTMAGLEKSPGLSQAGIFRIYFTGPTGRTFNFADAHDGAGSAPSMFWLARTFNCGVCAWHHRQEVRGSAMDLIWYSQEGKDPAASGLALSKYFRKDDVVFLRSAWNDPQALWVGFKGGDNAANHSHLDTGAFVMDALGQRWAADLGSDDYNMPGYFGNKRWTYYRLRTESHNTLLINGENQAPKAKAPIVAFAAAGRDGSAVANLTQAYPQAKSVLRGIAMQGGRRILIQDEVEAAAPVEVLWGMVTQAKVTLDKCNVALEQGGKRLYGRILAPEGAVFETVSCSAPPPEHQQPDARKLVVRLPGKVTSLRLAVAFSPDPPGAAAPAAVKPLAAWPGW